MSLNELNRRMIKTAGERHLYAMQLNSKAYLDSRNKGKCCAGMGWDGMCGAVCCTVIFTTTSFSNSFSYLTLLLNLFHLSSITFSLFFSSASSLSFSSFIFSLSLSLLSLIYLPSSAHSPCHIPTSRYLILPYLTFPSLTIPLPLPLPLPLHHL